jgi:hypothetical protein
MSSRFATLKRLPLLYRHTRLEDWVLQKLAGLETFCHSRMRRESFPKRVFTVLLLLASALAACISLLLSKTSSFEDADEVCQERFAIAMAELTSFQEQIWENGSNSELKPGLSAPS